EPAVLGRRRRRHARLVRRSPSSSMEPARQPAVETEEQERVQRMEHAAPASAPGEGGLREGQEGEQERQAPDLEVGVPREQRDDQEQDRDRLREDETERAMRIEGLLVVELRPGLDPEDSLAGQEDLDDDRD